MQWRKERRDGLNTFAKARGLDPRSENAQLEYTDWELNNTERASGDQLRSAQDLDGANDAMMNYLRPSGWTAKNPKGGHAYANRVDLSKAVLGDTSPTEQAPVQYAGSDQSDQPDEQDQLDALRERLGLTQPQQAQAQPTIWDALDDAPKGIDLGLGEEEQGQPFAPLQQAQAHRGILSQVFARPKRGRG
jgi:hypothetical protein